MIQEKHQLNGMGAEPCDCCQVSLEREAAAYDCAARRTVFTAREQEVLARIRAVSEKAREVRKRLEQLAGGPGEYGGEHAAAITELEDLRRMRAELESERVAAAEERMRLLGHA